MKMKKTRWGVEEGPRCGPISEDRWDLKVEAWYVNVPLSAGFSYYHSHAAPRVLHDCSTNYGKHSHCESGNLRLADHPSFPFRGPTSRAMPSALEDSHCFRSILAPHRGSSDHHESFRFRSPDRTDTLQGARDRLAACLSSCWFSVSDTWWPVVGLDIHHGFEPVIDCNCRFCLGKDPWGLVGSKTAEIFTSDESH